MLSPAGIRERARKVWESQRFLRAWLSGDSLFPLSYALGTPTGASLATQFNEVRDAIAALKAESKDVKGRGYRLQEEAVAHRQLGSQRLPMYAVIDDGDDFLALVGKRQDFRRFVALVEETRHAVPALMPYLLERPLTVLSNEANWTRLLAVCRHLQARPRPGCYLRELDIPGVDSKFIEQNMVLLWDLLTMALPPEAIDTAVERRAKHGFEHRFGLRFEAPTLRFRVLDPAFALAGFTDLTVSIPEFAAWRPGLRQVFVTENKVSGLAFPAVPGAIVVFGMGYGLQSLAGISWWSGLPIAYWGDLDTHGFAMLARLRALWPQTTSILMSQETLLAHRDLWGQEIGTRSVGELVGLTDEEQRVFDGLRHDVWGPRVRLEQERLPLWRLKQELGI